MLEGSDAIVGSCGFASKPTGIVECTMGSVALESGVIAGIFTEGGGGWYARAPWGDDAREDCALRCLSSRSSFACAYLLWLGRRM